jgi:3-deoxy-manno-octulosonate cytidylyltransferase (CMP-KDO synthetase)
VSATDFVIVIPARYASQRLPGKLLQDVNGRPLIEHVWRRAMESAARQVLIATDDERIDEAARRFGAQSVMTGADHSSGTDRIAECAALQGWSEDQLIVNLQGDEPLMPPECLTQVAGLLASDPAAGAASLYATIEAAKEASDPNVVKVVTDQGGRALLFSRSTIPHARDFATVVEAMGTGLRWRRHVGLYAYRLAALDWFARTAPTPLEETEKLEQLRFLEHGRHIVLAEATVDIPPGVDTQEDLARVRALL